MSQVLRVRWVRYPILLFSSFFIWKWYKLHCSSWWSLNFFSAIPFIVRCAGHDSILPSKELSARSFDSRRSSFHGGQFLYPLNVCRLKKIQLRLKINTYFRIEIVHVQILYYSWVSAFTACAQVPVGSLVRGVSPVAGICGYDVFYHCIVEVVLTKNFHLWISDR